MHELDDDAINLIVKDNGMGIPEDFDPFGSETLGLKLVISMVENQLKGTIKQTRNEGTGFSIEIPKP
jgi:two-component sensor histidine kinase